MLQVETFVFNPVAVNTYVVWDDETAECIVVDAGNHSPDEHMLLQHFIESNRLTVKHLAATHLHFDHIFGNRFVSNRFEVGLSAHPDDRFLLDNFAMQARIFGIESEEDTIPVSHCIHEGDSLTAGKYTFTALHVPGHSPGSLVYYCAEAGIAFGGDVLFRGSIGRTDLWGGNYDQLIDGIKKKLLVLPDATTVYTGHGPRTTVGYEKSRNPYLQ